MYAYVFGEFGSDLSAALELVGQGEEGDRIRAVAEVTVGDFGSVIAIEAPTMEALDGHVSAFTGGSGTYTQKSAMLMCTLPSCNPVALPDRGVIPAYLPAFTVMAFVLVETAGPVQTWPDFRSPGLAVGVEAGGRRALLELGADDVETIQEDLAALGEAREVTAIRASYLSGSRLSTAEADRAQGA